MISSKGAFTNKLKIKKVSFKFAGQYSVAQLKDICSISEEKEAYLQ